MAGKEYTIVVLSSSPPVPVAFNSPRYAAPTRRVAMPPSSPFALSPPGSPKNHASGALASGSWAAPIPETATRGFATVSSLVHSEHFAQQAYEDLAEAQPARQRLGSHKDVEESITSRKRTTKRIAKKTAPADGEKPVPKSRARKPKADKGIETTKTTLDPELRLSRTTRSPFFETAESRNSIDPPAESAADAPKLTKSGKPRKPRAKKAKPEDGSTEPKPKRTRATKAQVVAKAGKASREAADNDFACTAIHKDHVNGVNEESSLINDQLQQGASIWDVPQSPRSNENAKRKWRTDILEAGLDLEEAVSRRRNWTPTRDTVAESPPTVSPGKENELSIPGAVTGNFTHLISNFTYESPTGKATNDAATSTIAISNVTKRRRVELIELPGVQTTSRASSPEKGKAPKKKPRTITELVTGQYAPKDPTSEVQPVTSDFFSPRVSTTKVPLNDLAQADVEITLKKPPRKRSKPKNDSEATTSKVKPRTRKPSTKSATKTKPAVEKLLSPASAVLRMNRQDVLFGTSSQLALEESPTTVRQIQRAIKESEQDEPTTTSLPLGIPPRWPGLQHVEGKRNLWRESTRDSDGLLLENAENVCIPAPDRTQDLPLLIDVARGESDLQTEFVDIDDIEPPAPITLSSDLPIPPGSQIQKHDAEMTPVMLVSDIFDDIDDFNSGPPPSNQNAEAQDSFADIDDFQLPPRGVPQAAPVTAAVKDLSLSQGRPRKVERAISVVSAQAPPPACKPLPSQQRSKQLLTSPPKGSGRFVDIEEILDSEDEVLEAFSPLPPRVRKLQDSPPLPLTFNREPSEKAVNQIDKSVITPISRVQISKLEWASIRPSICAGITAHIRSIPPTMDPKKPSWHERILMYDPIVLEDLTTYLNNNTKLHTYKRATLKQIKAYNSNLKMQGNAVLEVERDDQVLAIEKELEVYMVRDWCQEMSICCVHAKESRGRGSARKGFY